jgi:hypothetical protein
LEVGSKTAELCEQQTREQLRAMIRAVEPQLVAEMLQSFAREAAERAMGVTLSPLSSSGHDVTCKFIDELAEKQAQWAAHKALLWTAAQRPKNGVLQ